MSGEGSGETNKKKFRIPLAYTALMLCAVAFVQFLATVILDFSVDNLIEALLDLAFQVLMTSVFVLIVVMVRARRKRRGGQG